MSVWELFIPLALGNREKESSIFFPFSLSNTLKTMNICELQEK